MGIIIQMQLSEKLYLRDPQQTKLGKKILQYSIELIEEMGFERFTFKKLAQHISSTEASIYRYFENKHKLLVYLVSWYWEWIKYQIGYQTMNIQDPKQKLSIVLRIIVESAQKNLAVEHIDESLLHRIVIAEAPKAYLTKQVDEENEDGFFVNYKSLCTSIAEIITAYNPHFSYPRALSSTLLEMVNNQIYFAEHLPSLTDIKWSETVTTDIIQMLEHFTFGLLDKAP